MDNILTKEKLKNIQLLRQNLHSIPEPSGHEIQTKNMLMSFLRQYTSCDIIDCDTWFYAIHREENATETIAFRADMDAICRNDSTVFHGCGHDGHSACTAGLAYVLENTQVGNNIIFLFQPAEENGRGALQCECIIAREHINRIYGFHNIPNVAHGVVLIKNDVFACASVGMRIKLMGCQSHAAYPECGVNPAFTIAKIINSLDQLTNDKCYINKPLVTVISVDVGVSGAFGISAGTGMIELTLRAHYTADLELLKQKIISLANELKNSVEYFDEFTDTTNSKPDYDLAKHVFDECGIPYAELEEPFRWSEDFGRYLKLTDGMFFGVGAKASPLHTDEYEFDDSIISNVINVFTCLAKSKRNIS